MKSESIEGIGSVYGGEYDTILVEGMGKLKGDVTAKKVIVEGIFKGKGRITTDEMRIEGVARVFRDIRAKNVKIEGMLKLRRASLNADKVICEGIMVANREVCADDIYIDGVCSVSNMYGDNVVLKSNVDRIKGSRNFLPVKLKPFFKLYFGRNVSLDHFLIDVLECTNLEAERVKAKVIRANSVKLKDHCMVDKLFCDGEIFIDDTCYVGQIISRDWVITDKKEMSDMANMTLVKILDLYKDGKINADEAEKMINSIRLNSRVGHTSGNADNLPWEDDGKFRIVAYIGRRLLKKGEPGAAAIEVKYDGEALNVECYGNLTCGNVNGNVSAGGSVNCGDIEGNVTAGGSIYCQNIGGRVTAGGGVHIGK